MDTPLDEQKCFDHVTSLISVSPNTVIPQGCLAHDLIEKVEVEVKRLKHLKASKMKELVLKKMTELEEIYRSVHMDIDSDHEWRILTELIDSATRNRLDRLMVRTNERLPSAVLRAQRRNVYGACEQYLGLERTDTAIKGPIQPIRTSRA